MGKRYLLVRRTGEKKDKKMKEKVSNNRQDYRKRNMYRN